jgi:hypothetical protein
LFDFISFEHGFLYFKWLVDARLKPGERGFPEGIGRKTRSARKACNGSGREAGSRNFERLNHPTRLGLSVQFELPEESLQPVASPTVLKEGGHAQLGNEFPCGAC